MIASQKKFGGGLNTIVSDTQIADDMYVWGVNIRSRYDKLEPIPKHVELSEYPAGLKQGIIAVGNFLILFVEGKAYFQEDGTASWIQIPAFSMSTTALKYYTVSIPSSTLNFARKNNADGNVTAPIIVDANFKVDGTPTGIVVQDGENQAYLIQYDNDSNVFTSRVTKGFNDWANTSDSKEYVPIGKQMMFMNGILFIVAPDGKSVYRSITGRPLDFMIAVDTDGNKGDFENDSGAPQTSFAFDFDIITCIQTINTPDSFILATRYNTRILTLDYLNTIFGEPTIRESARVNSGVLNQYSFIDLIGDYALINQNTVVSFDAVQVLKFKGKNSIFSLPLSKFTKNIKQQSPSCIAFDNYAIFNIDTNIGNLMAVYDLLRSTWCSFDVTDVVNIKQFAIVDTGASEKLYCITEFDEVYQMFASTTEVYLSQVRTKSFVNDDSRVEHKTQQLRTVFDSSVSDGETTVIEYVDGQFSNRVKQPIKCGTAGVGPAKDPDGNNLGIFPPIVPSTISIVDNPSYVLRDGRKGKKIYFIIQWNVNASLIEYTFTSRDDLGNSSQKQGANVIKDIYANS